MKPRQQDVPIKTMPASWESVPIFPRPRTLPSAWPGFPYWAETITDWTGPTGSIGPMAATMITATTAGMISPVVISVSVCQR